MQILEIPTTSDNAEKGVISNALSQVPPSTYGKNVRNTPRATGRTLHIRSSNGKVWRFSIENTA